MKTSRRERIAAKLAVTAVAVGGLGVLGVQPASAAVIVNDGGPAVITSPPAGTAPLNSGTQATDWIVKLPGGAHCTGDTASGTYLVFTYVVPSSVDPGTLTFTPDGPNQGFPLYDNAAAPVEAKNTNVTTGGVVPVPFYTMNWAVYDTSVLPAGTYNVGIACAKTGGSVLDKYWNVQETFTADPADSTKFNWAVVPGTDVPEAPLAILLPVSLVGLLGVGVYMTRRRRTSEVLAAN